MRYIKEGLEGTRGYARWMHSAALSPPWWRIQTVTEVGIYFAGGYGWVNSFSLGRKIHTGFELTPSMDLLSASLQIVFLGGVGSAGNPVILYRKESI